ncbi:hypothetical protein MUP77_06695 [Candidatus Bathyarchaeota archaeon]|nr:hypothetical protein [Candidatus Bathyarchaeota archaeon]
MGKRTHAKRDPLQDGDTPLSTEGALQRPFLGPCPRGKGLTEQESPFPEE